MSGKISIRWLLFGFVGLIIAAGIAVWGFDLLPRKTDPPASRSTKTPLLNACQYLTNEEVGIFLGHTPERAPTNSDANGGIKDTQIATCEYGSALLRHSLIITIAKGLTPEAIAEEHTIAGQPIDTALEESYTMLGHSGFITREHTGEEGRYVLASARFLTKEGSVQVNAASFEIVEKVMANILPKIDGEQ